MTAQVSVVMPVHNTVRYLAQAIESTLCQSFADFEFLIGDDASDDGSTEVIQWFGARDARIKVLRSDVQLGPAGSSSWTAEAAASPLVARMDSDDVCHPDRLRLQVAALQAHPQAVMVASLLQMIDREGRTIRNADYSILLNREYLPAPHPSIMYRRQAYLAAGGYQGQTDYFEDRVLIERLQSQGDVLIIAAPLLSYRMAGTSARLNDDQDQVEDRLNGLDSLNPMKTRRSTVGRCISPLVFRSLGSLRLWSYLPAKILPSMIRRMRLFPLLPAMETFFWASIVTFTPSLARNGSRLLLAWRNWHVRCHVRPRHLYRWVADALPEDLGPAGV